LLFFEISDELEPPAREILAPLRIPLSNVFKSQGSGAAVSGRVCAGVVQVGEKLRILPGDETGVVKCKPLFLSQCSLTDRFKAIEIEDASVPWAAAGSNVTLYLTAIDPVNLNIGSVLCPPGDLVPLAAHFTARIIVFDIQVPITAGTSVIAFDIKNSIFHLLLSARSLSPFSRCSSQHSEAPLHT
jgi:elongation factor 1 alpha-like protein